MNERKTILETLYYIDDGSNLNTLIDDLLKIQEDNKDFYENIYLNMDYREDYCNITIVGQRKENNEEYRKRIENEEMWKEKTKEQEKQKLLELMEKYPELIK